MKLHLIILSVFVTSGLALPAETMKEFEDEFKELWSDPETEALAAKELADEEASIEQDNLDYANGKSSYSEKLNALSALPKDEFEAEKLGGLEGPIYAKGLIETPEAERTISPEDQAYLNKIYEDLDREYIPSSYDARSYGLITKPKSQGSCGSCAAFAAMSTIETCMRRAGTPLDGLDIAEQHLVDCGYNPSNGMNGCNGAWIGAYQSWMGQSKPDVSHEAQYPYLDRDPNLKCLGKPTWNTGAKVTSAITDYGCNEDKLKKLVYKYGAVATGIYAGDNSFGNYAKGVYDTCSSTQMNHAVTVVGYGTESGKPYWVVKNSWGDNWGDGGYIKIARGNSECGIGSQCALVECTKTGTASAAPQAPTPAPIPASQICDISNLYGTDQITGHYTLTSTIDKKEYIANVKCTNSKCSPAVAGPSNACMYICGKTEC
jgi:cathepsin L